MKVAKILTAVGFVMVLALVADAQSPFCSTPNLAIPDNTPAGVSNSQMIGDTFTLIDLNVSIQTAHTWVGDLIFRLSKTAGPGAPIGPITIIDRPGVPASTFGCSGNDIDTVLDDGNPDVENVCNAAAPAIDMGPYGPSPGGLNANFAGISIEGTWQLTVSDNAGGDLGTLNEWCLITDPVPVELMEFQAE